jgi:membrane protein YdbS with pleckstrin-like domain
MTTRLPPELMSTEERDARAGELEYEISRQWVQFAIVEAVALWVPFAIFLLAYVFTDAISDSQLVPAVIVAVALSILLVTYWVVRRIHPLQKELRALRGA